MGEFRMPSLGADMTEGTLLEWLVGPGDVVHRGDVVAVVDTVKTAIDVETFEEGEVERLLVQPGTTVAVGTPLALLRASGTAEPSAAGPARPAAPVPPEPPVVTTSAAAAPLPAPTTPASPVVRRLARERGVDLATVVGHGRHGEVTRHDVETAVATPGPGRVRSSPLARRRAAALGVDLARLVGSGPDGAVTARDVERAAETTVAVPLPAAPASASRLPAPPATAPVATGDGRTARDADAGTAERRAAMQAATAALMARSKREIPHFYLQTTIDLATTTAWLARRNAGRPSAERLLASALLLAATARALRAAPELNGFVTEAGVEQRDVVDLGVAVSMRSGGLVVATLHDAGSLGVDDLMAALKDLAVRTRSGRLRSSEMTTPTITVTNLGDQGADLVHGVIYPPQVALVGFGRVVSRPWAVDGMLTVRPLVVATLAADHRVSDGHRGSLFLAALDAALQTPEEL